LFNAMQMISLADMTKFINGDKGPLLSRLAAVALALAISACGQSGMTSAQNQNAAVTMSAAEKKSLGNLELVLYQNTSQWQDCVSSKSVFYPEAAQIIDKANPVVARMTDIAPPLLEVKLLDAPPRSDNAVGIFLCDRMTSNAYALYRTISLSNEFIAKLKEAALANGGDNATFTSALAFVIYHELGHAALNHSALKIRDNAQFGLAQELEADQFALDLMTSVGLDKKGVDVARSVAGGI
jgi:hypothetical protein